MVLPLPEQIGNAVYFRKTLGPVSRVSTLRTGCYVFLVMLMMKLLSIIVVGLVIQLLGRLPPQPVFKNNYSSCNTIKCFPFVFLIWHIKLSPLVVLPLTEQNGTVVLVLRMGRKLWTGCYLYFCGVNDEVVFFCCSRGGYTNGAEITTLTVCISSTKIVFK